MVLLLLISFASVTIGPSGGTISLKAKGAEIASLRVPEGAVDINVPFEIHELTPPHEELWGWKILKGVEVSPPLLVTKKPLSLRMYVSEKEKGAIWVYRYKDIFFPLASIRSSSEYIEASIYHGGSYFLAIPKREIELYAKKKSKDAILLIGDLVIDNSFPTIEKVFNEKRYKKPVWYFPLRPGEDPLMASERLSKELRKLHEKFGKFKVDVIGLGLGGLVAYHYLTDTTLYNGDFGNAFVSIGTPYRGSNLASPDSAYKVRKPSAYFFVDVLGANALGYLFKGEKIKEMDESEGRYLSGFFNPELVKENVNSVNLLGRLYEKAEESVFPEITEGDGLVSVSSGKLTSLEPRPFPLDHFSLLSSRDVLELAAEFLIFYHGWNWPQIFLSVWRGDLPEDTVASLWLRETELHLRSNANLEVLLEWNRNLLSSVPKGGILITNGDYDTFPGWYLQLRENFRKDILIVNRSLCWLKEYLVYLDKRKGLKIDKERLIGNDFIKLLVKNTSRPVTFAITVSNPEIFTENLRLRGLVYEVGRGDINIAVTDSLIHQVFRYDVIRSLPPDSFTGAVKRILKNYQALILRAAYYFKENGMKERALKETDFVLSLPFVSPMVWFGRARILEEMGKKTLAVKSYEKVLESNPDDWEVILASSKPLIKLGKKEVVFKAVSFYLSRHPEDKRAVELLKSL